MKHVVIFFRIVIFLFGLKCSVFIYLCANFFDDLFSRNNRYGIKKRSNEHNMDEEKKRKGILNIALYYKQTSLQHFRRFCFGKSSYSSFVMRLILRIKAKFTQFAKICTPRRFSIFGYNCSQF